MPLSRSSVPQDKSQPPGEDLSASQIWQAVTAAGVGMWEWDHAARRLTWSKQEKALFGLPPDAEITYERFIACVHPDDRARVDELNQRVFAEEQARDKMYEYRVVWPDGSVHWLTDRGQVIYDGQGHIERIIGVAMDVTEMKQAEEALREERNVWHLLADASPGIVGIFNGDGYLEYANQRWYDFSGTTAEHSRETPDRIGGEKWFTYCHPDDVEKLKAGYQEAWSSGQPVELEARMPEGKTGKYRWFQVDAVPVKDAAGKVLKWLIVSSDIQERKRTEEALRESEMRLRRLMQSNSIGFLVSNLNGPIYEANDAFLSLLGYTRKDLEAGRLNWIKLTVPEYQERDQEAVGEERVMGSFTPFEKEYLAKDGRRVPVLVGGTLLGQENSEQRELCFVMDLSAPKAMERQKDLFLSMTGHELKTPLAALRGILQLTQRRMKRLIGKDEPLSPEVSKFFAGLGQTLKDSFRQIDAQTRLINDLQDVSRITANTLKLTLEECELRVLILRTVEDLRLAHPERALHLQLPERTSVTIMADQGRISQVLTNYVNNALRYSSSDQPVWIGLRIEAPLARVWVRDKGPGLTKEAQRDIWQSFHQVEGVPIQSGSGKGLGLGLYICRTLIVQHEGQVGVESAPGEGSTFWFTLPLITPSTYNAPTTDEQ